MAATVAVRPALPGSAAFSSTADLPRCDTSLATSPGPMLSRPDVISASASAGRVPAASIRLSSTRSKGRHGPFPTPPARPAGAPSREPRAALDQREPQSESTADQSSDDHARHCQAEQQRAALAGLRCLD
jgi:hypothetical protein